MENRSEEQTCFSLRLFYGSLLCSRRSVLCSSGHDTSSLPWFLLNPGNLYIYICYIYLCTFHKLFVRIWFHSFTQTCLSIILNFGFRQYYNNLFNFFFLIWLLVNISAIHFCVLAVIYILYVNCIFKIYFFL